MIIHFLFEYSLPDLAYVKFDDEARYDDKYRFQKSNVKVAIPEENFKGGKWDEGEDWQ